MIAIVRVWAIDRGITVLFVSLRQRKQGEKVDICDEIETGDIGLNSIVMFQNPNGWNLNPEEISDEALKQHAEKMLEYGKSFLTDPNADWAGLRERLRQEREKLLAENPEWKKYSRH
jgi:hypothetical protein